MKRFNLLFTLLASIFLANAQGNTSISPTNLVYDVNWKWGLVNLNVGKANVYMQCQDDVFYGTLSGHSIPWESHVYSVGDTLQAKMANDSEIIQYITGWYRKPHVNSSVDLANPKNYKTILGQGQLSASPNTMEAISITANMIGLFYYAKCIDFETMCNGETKIIPITTLDGIPQQLQLIFHGKGKSTIDGETDVYNVTFNYMYDGQMSSYPVSCQIDIIKLLPIYFAADIRIGHVQMWLAS